MSVCTDLSHRLPAPNLDVPYFWLRLLRGLVDRPAGPLADVDRELLPEFDAWQAEYDRWNDNYHAACAVCCGEDDQ